MRALIQRNLPVKKNVVVVTCEHAGYRVPEELVDVIPVAKRRVLSTHEGWDIGALQIAQKLAADFSAPLFFSDISRLVCDLNRTARLTGPFARNIKPFLEKMPADELLGRYYWPYRMKVEEILNTMIKEHGTVLHLSIHSFTPKLKGEVRNADIGILYDPHRGLEKDFAARLKESMQQVNLDHSQNGASLFYRVRMNYPYMGTDDGFTTYLRTIFDEANYVGVEIEFNQAHLSDEPGIDAIYGFFKESLETSISD